VLAVDPLAPRYLYGALRTGALIWGKDKARAKQFTQHEVPHWMNHIGNRVDENVVFVCVARKPRSRSMSA
jgi:hypothetical protein